MRKITLVLVLTFLLNSVLFAVPSQATYDSFDELGALGILNADIANRAQNTENVLTRGEAIFILSHLYADMNIEPCATDFSDVTKEHKYSGYIKYLADLGVVGGVGDGSFLPDAPIKAEHLYIPGFHIIPRGIRDNLLIRHTHKKLLIILFTPGRHIGQIDSINFYKLLLY